MASDEVGEGEIDFQPAAQSTPKGSGTQIDAPLATSTPKKNIRFMDESISKIHVFPNLPATPSFGRKVRNFATALPTIPDEPQPFNPILYTFRVPDKWPQNMPFLRVRPPPFYLQLDHTIAVIWCLFSSSAKKNLGIAQLQWALSFLNSIRNKTNDRPKDVDICIEAIQDYLIELYSEICNKLEPLKNMEKSIREVDEAPIETEIPFSINYHELFEKSIILTESALGGGALYNFDDIYRKEIDELKDIAGASSAELMTSKSREAAIDYLSNTRDKHLSNLAKEAQRVRSLNNMLKLICEERRYQDTFNNLESALLSVLRAEDSSDINNTSDLNKTENK